FAVEDPGYIYCRLCNPTTTELEKKIAHLEGSEAAAATATGMGAVTASVLSLTLINNSEPTRLHKVYRMPSSACRQG
ncbi:PLP-dependent transferase, partial [Pseudoalteromonas marina]